MFEEISVATPQIENFLIFSSNKTFLADVPKKNSFFSELVSSEPHYKIKFLKAALEKQQIHVEWQRDAKSAFGIENWQPKTTNSKQARRKLG